MYLLSAPASGPKSQIGSLLLDPTREMSPGGRASRVDCLHAAGSYFCEHGHYLHAGTVMSIERASPLLSRMAVTQDAAAAAAASASRSLLLLSVARPDCSHDAGYSTVRRVASLSGATQSSSVV